MVAYHTRFGNGYRHIKSEKGSSESSIEPSDYRALTCSKITILNQIAEKRKIPGVAQSKRPIIFLMRIPYDTIPVN
jgi:hypothetical protein